MRERVSRREPFGDHKPKRKPAPGEAPHQVSTWSGIGEFGSIGPYRFHLHPLDGGDYPINRKVSFRSHSFFLLHSRFRSYA